MSTSHGGLGAMHKGFLFCFFPLLETKGAFHAAKNSGLHFRKFPVWNGNSISTISAKKDNLGSYTQIFENFLLGISVPFLIFIPQFPEFSVEWVAFR